MLNTQTELRQQQTTNKQMGYGLNAGLSAANIEVMAEVMAAAAANNNNNAASMQELITMFKSQLEKLEQKLEAKFSLICQPVGEKPKRPPRIIDNNTYCWTHG
jgi:uncharacterized protein (DUF885 family)